MSLMFFDCVKRGSSSPYRWVNAAAIVCCGLVPIVTAAQQLPPSDRQSVVVATVDGQPVYEHEVTRALTRAVPLLEQQTDFLRARTRQRLVDRLAIVKWLERHGQAASDEDVDSARKRLEKQLGRREIAWAKYLQLRGMTEAELYGELKWKLSWQRFLNRFLTDDNLEKFFRNHRRQFDGTKLRVAHILLQVEPSDDASELADQRIEASRIREEILAGKMSFAEAARQYSAAPTGEGGGDIGFISRHDPMPESFSQVAYELTKDEVSQPVVTAFGVHLIKCLDLEPGQKQWQDVRSQLETAVTQYLFAWAAERGRRAARIKFSDAAAEESGGRETGDLDR